MVRRRGGPSGIQGRLSGIISTNEELKMTKTKEQRNAIKAELELIARQGTLTPDAVVSAASNPSSALHSEFDWDDSAAATKWRLSQARDLISSIRVEIISTEVAYSIPAYVRDPRRAPMEQGYVALSVVMTNAQLTNGVLQQEFARVRAALHRARDLAAALEKQEQIDALIDSVVELHEWAKAQASSGAIAGVGHAKK